MTLQMKYLLTAAIVLTALWIPATGRSQSAPDPILIEGA